MKLSPFHENVAIDIDIAAISRRDCSIADFLVFWLSQSFRPFCGDVPRAIDAGAAISLGARLPTVSASCPAVVFRGGLHSL